MTSPRYSVPSLLPASHPLFVGYWKPTVPCKEIWFIFYFDSFNLQKSCVNSRKTSHELLTQKPTQVLLNVSATSVRVEGPHKAQRAPTEPVVSIPSLMMWNVP